MIALILLLPAQPTVVLAGDSIRHGYAPLVAKMLEGEAKIVSPVGAGDSAWLLKNLDTLVLKHKPALVHVNVGLHDLRKSRKEGKHQIEIESYEKNLDTILKQLPRAVFALTTPVDDERGKARKAGFDRLSKDVTAYNAAALRVAFKQGVPVHDLHSLVERHGGSKLLARDGTHFTREGAALQARAVADCVRRHLFVATIKPRVYPPVDEKATATYLAAQTKRDAGIPAYFKKLPVPTFVPPRDAAEWKKRRPAVREAVWKTLGDMPSRPRPSSTLLSIERRAGFTLESLEIPNGINGSMTALWLVPTARKKKGPAVLWLHSTAQDARHLLARGQNGGDEPFGQTLTKAGYCVLAPDAAWYGRRAGRGPSGPASRDRAQHDELAKFHLWMGRTLWGMFVRDDLCALDWLCARPEVDATRIGVTGMSMGSTRSWWLQALDERVACAVGVACLTRYQNLIAHGELRRHGDYYFVMGLLKHFDIEGVLALSAPRPFLALTGELDAGSPADGIRQIEKFMEQTYAALGAKDAFKSVLYKHTGHTHTPQMRAATMAWFKKWLKPE